MPLLSIRTDKDRIPRLWLSPQEPEALLDKSVEITQEEIFLDSKMMRHLGFIPVKRDLRGRFLETEDGRKREEKGLIEISIVLVGQIWSAILTDPRPPGPLKIRTKEWRRRL